MTGATGLLGSCCLPHLVARHGPKQIVALVRPRRDISSLAKLGIVIAEGDVALPALGLARGQYAALASSVRMIVHSAADIRFSVSLDESRRTNVSGTENLLTFARVCTRLEKFAHMSTAYVSGGREGRILEEAARPGPFFNSYQQSKYEAEQAVLGATGVIPASIYRFSTMIYDGASSRVKQFNYFHQLLRLALHNPLDMIPANPEAPIDLILSDWAANAFDLLFEERFRPGEILHICSGAESSLKVRELFETTFASLPVAGRPPTIVDQHYFEQHLSSILTTASRRQMWRNLSHFLPHMNVAQTFETEKLRSLRRDDLRPPDMRSIFPKVLSYCVATNWGAGPAHSFS